MDMIVILCPTRSRQAQFDRMVRSANATASSNECFSILSATNCDDSEWDTNHYANIKFPKDIPTGFMWNKLCEIALSNQNNKLFMLGADDMVFTTPCWDKALLDHYDALENKIHVYALQDSRDENGTPHIIVTREYIEAMGYFVPPIFLHWYIDSWTVEIAKSNGCFTHLKDYMLEHIKPSDNGQGDETHNGIRRMGWHERDTWVADKCQHFLELEKKRLVKIIVDNHFRRYYCQFED